MVERGARGRDVAPGHVGHGRCRRAAVRRRVVRRRGLPVRRDVLPVEAGCVRRGGARAAPGWTPRARGVGPHRGQRVRRRGLLDRDRAVPRRPARGSSSRCRTRTTIPTSSWPTCSPAGSRRRTSNWWSTAARPPPQRSSHVRTAPARRCTTSSSGADRIGSAAALAASTRALEDRFGATDLDGRISALVATAWKA